MTRIFTCDLDSTLCNTSKRYDKHQTGRLMDWAAYAKDCGMDTPFEGVVRMVWAMQQTLDWYAVSARDEGARDETEKWLAEHGLNPQGILLDDQTFTADHGMYKARRIKSLQKYGFDVQFHIDDWEAVRVAVERECNVPVVVVSPGYDGPKTLR